MTTTFDTNTTIAATAKNAAPKYEGGMLVPTTGHYVALFATGKLVGLFEADDKEATRSLGQAQRFESEQEANSMASDVRGSWNLAHNEAVRVISLSDARKLLK